MFILPLLSAVRPTECLIEFIIIIIIIIITVTLLGKFICSNSHLPYIRFDLLSENDRMDPTDSQIQP